MTDFLQGVLALGLNWRLLVRGGRFRRAGSCGHAGHRRSGFGSGCLFCALVRREIIRAQQVNNPADRMEWLFSLGLNIVKVIIDVCGHVLIIVPVAGIGSLDSRR